MVLTQQAWRGDTLLAEGRIGCVQSESLKAPAHSSADLAGASARGIVGRQPARHFASAAVVEDVSLFAS